MADAKQTVIQLVPGAPPLLNGVGDYALTIARAMRAERGIDSIFLVCRPDWIGPAGIDGFRFVPLHSRKSADLFKSIEHISAEAHGISRILLQLSPYGFSNSGAPFWVLRALRRWKALNPNRELLVYFHELYATSAPWRRGFWLSPAQRLCVRGFARVADHALTSMELYAERLVRWAPDKAGQISIIPMVSNVGEPNAPFALTERRHRLVIWGSASAKRDLYTLQHTALESAVQAAGIAEVLDIGPRWPSTPHRIGAALVSTVGVLSAHEVSHCLSNSLLAACSYSPDYLSKSTLFAAYCAHGIPVVVLPPDPRNHSGRDGMRAGKHFLVSVPPQGPSVITQLEAVAAAAHMWYMEHAVSNHARVYAQLISHGG